MAKNPIFNMAAAAILNFKNFNFAHVAVIGFKFLKSKMADSRHFENRLIAISQ